MVCSFGPINSDGRLVTRLASIGVWPKKLVRAAPWQAVLPYGEKSHLSRKAGDFALGLLDPSGEQFAKIARNGHFAKSSAMHENQIAREDSNLHVHTGT